MAETVVGIDIVASLAGLKDKMAEIPGIGADTAKKLAAELSKGIKQNTAALNQQRTAAAAAAKSTAALGGAASKAAKAFGPLGGILARLSPEAGAVSSSIASATTALEGLGVAGPGGVAAIAAVTAAAALGYTTYRVYTEESDRAAETAAMVAKAHKELAPFMDTARDATIALRVATGELTEEEGRLETAALKAWRAVNAATAGAKEGIAGLQAKQTSALRQGLDMFDGTFGWTPLGQAVDAFTTSASEAGEQQRALTGALNKSVVATKSVVEADRAAIKAGADRTAGLKDTAAAIRVRIAEEERLADATDSFAKSEARRISEQSPTSLENQTKDFSDDLAARHKAEEEELKAAKEFDERMAEIEDDATERALRNEKRREAGSIAAQASMADFALTAQDAIAKAAEHGTEAQKQQLRAVWKVTQGVRAAEAIINGAGAFARALADYPYPRPGPPRSKSRPSWGRSRRLTPAHPTLADAPTSSPRGSKRARPSPLGRARRSSDARTSTAPTPGEAPRPPPSASPTSIDTRNTTR